MNIEELKKLATPLVKIPGFDNGQTIEIRLQKPRIFTLAAEGKIPNHLMSTAAKMAGAKSENKEQTAKDVGLMLELYCRACMVEPAYEEAKDFITDEQKTAIMEWAMGEVEELKSFRADGENGSDNNDGEGV